MIWRRLVSGAMTLMAAHYAAFGIRPACGDEHRATQTASAEVTPGMAHDGPMHSGSTDPCVPASGHSSGSHTPLSCLAMAGCAASGIVDVSWQELPVPLVSVALIARPSSSLHSILFPPETPPPIA